MIPAIVGERARPITTGSFDHVRPSWSRNERWIYCGSNRGGDTQVWKVPVDGGEPVLVTRNGGRVAYESPDGKSVYYHKGPQTSGIWRVAVTGGEETLVVEQADAQEFGVSEGGIYFASLAAGNRQTIRFFDFRTAEVMKISDTEGTHASWSGVAVSPDGQSVLYGQNDQAGSDIMLVENFR